jgi:hypothetical protein
LRHWWVTAAVDSSSFKGNMAHTAPTYPAFKGIGGFEFIKWKEDISVHIPKIATSAHKSFGYQGPGGYLDFLALSCFPMGTPAHMWWKSVRDTLMNTPPPHGDTHESRFWHIIEARFGKVNDNTVKAFEKDPSNAQRPGESPLEFYGRIQSRLEAAPSELMSDLRKTDLVKSWLRPEVQARCIETFKGLVEKKRSNVGEIIRVAQLDHEYFENATQVTSSSAGASTPRAEGHSGKQPSQPASARPRRPSAFCKYHGREMRHTEQECFLNPVNLNARANAVQAAAAAAATNAPPVPPPIDGSVVCYWCQQKGHIQLNCPIKLANLPRVPRGGQATVTPPAAPRGAPPAAPRTTPRAAPAAPREPQNPGNSKTVHFQDKATKHAALHAAISALAAIYGTECDEFGDFTHMISGQHGLRTLKTQEDMLREMGVTDRMFYRYWMICECGRSMEPSIDPRTQVVAELKCPDCGDDTSIQVPNPAPMVTARSGGTPTSFPSAGASRASASGRPLGTPSRGLGPEEAEDGGSSDLDEHFHTPLSKGRVNFSPLQTKPHSPHHSSHATKNAPMPQSFLQYPVQPAVSRRTASTPVSSTPPPPPSFSLQPVLDRLGDMQTQQGDALGEMLAAVQAMRDECVQSQDTLMQTRTLSQLQNDVQTMRDECIQNHTTVMHAVTQLQSEMQSLRDESLQYMTRVVSEQQALMRAVNQLQLQRDPQHTHNTRSKTRSAAASAPTSEAGSEPGSSKVAASVLCVEHQVLGTGTCPIVEPADGDQGSLAGAIAAQQEEHEAPAGAVLQPTLIQVQHRTQDTSEAVCHAAVMLPNTVGSDSTQLTDAELLTYRATGAGLYYLDNRCTEEGVCVIVKGRRVLPKSVMVDSGANVILISKDMADDLHIPWVDSGDFLQGYDGNRARVCGQVDPVALVQGEVVLGVCCGTPYAVTLAPRILVISGPTMFDMLLGTPFDHLVGSAGIDSVHLKLHIRPAYWTEGNPLPRVQLPLRRRSKSPTSCWTPEKDGVCVSCFSSTPVLHLDSLTVVGELAS